MAQPQRQAYVHQDELCPPNKHYALIDANKKIDLDDPLCPNESKIMANILQNHPLRFNIAASSSVPWIYLGQLWHTLKENGSKYRLKFVLDRKEITMTLNDFRKIFQMPQATENNHERFVAAPKFSEMAPFFLNDLGFTLELRSPSNFKTTGLVQPWQTLGKMFARCLTMQATNVPMTQSQPIECTQGTYMTTNAHRSPNPYVVEGESSAQSRQNVEKVNEHLVAEEIEKMVEGTKNVEEDVVDNFSLNSPTDPGTRLEPGSYKESPEVEIIDVEQPINVIEEEEESAKDDYELRRRELTVIDPTPSSSTPSSSSPKPTLSMHNTSYRYSNPRLDDSKDTRKFHVLDQHLQEVMEESLPNMVDDRVKEVTKAQVPIYVAEGLILERTKM
ncbi:hypothetical protein Tco_0363060 [Tanacetum coccineum]